MIPNGKEMDWHGHKIVFDSERYTCRGCFFEDKDSCPECDEGLWVEEKSSPWHTGTPTESGWYYAVICKGWERPYNKLALVKDGKIYSLDDAGDCEDFPHEIVKYRAVWRFKGNQEKSEGILPNSGGKQMKYFSEDIVREMVKEAENIAFVRSCGVKTTPLDIDDYPSIEITDNPWHTGTPTEIEEDEYWKWNYVLVLHTEYDCIGDYLAGLLFAPDFERQVFTAPQGGGKELIVPFKDVVAWQKIEPYEEDA